MDQSVCKRNTGAVILSICMGVFKHLLKTRGYFDARTKKHLMAAWKVLGLEKLCMLLSNLKDLSMRASKDSRDLAVHMCQPQGQPMM